MSSWCIIIPYRNRKEHLDIFVPHYNKLFPNVPIIIVEQCNDLPFNLGKLVNIGFILRGLYFDYFAKHDIDMIGRDKFINYSKPINPTHIATKCSQFMFKMPYREYFGGVTLINFEDFIEVNGFPNNLNGWGAEDDILMASFVKKGFKIDRRECIFDSLPHKRDIVQSDYEKNVSILKQGRDFNNGISTCEFDIISTEIKNGYELIKVNFTND